MDNAGGHGSAEAIDEYTNMLKGVYNIEIIHQIPRSPFTNVLDLGVWMSIQSIVERRHYLKRATTKALVNTVKQTWDGSNLDSVLLKVFDRLKVVLCNLLRDKGWNSMVEENRGMKHRGIKIETVLKEIQSGKDAIDDLQNFVNSNEAVDDDDEIIFEEDDI